jgi:ankyrin repeat protein
MDSKIRMACHLFNAALLILLVSPPLFASSEQQETALVQAIRDGKMAEIEKSVSDGVDINNSGALRVAIQTGRPDIVSYLIAHGADPNGGYVMGGSIQTAIMEGTPEILNCLIDNGADVNQEFPNDTSTISTPLLFSVYNGRLEAARVLLERGADVNQVSRSGNTALRQAVRFTQGDQVLGFVKLLLQHGADPDFKNEDHRSARDAVNTLIYENISTLMEKAKPVKGRY